MYIYIYTYIYIYIYIYIFIYIYIYVYRPSKIKTENLFTCFRGKVAVKSSKSLVKMPNRRSTIKTLNKSIDCTVILFKC